MIEARHRMDEFLVYFAYGSNLHPERLRRRVPSCTVLGRGVIEACTLHFHKRGADGSAKCNLRFTSRRSDRVYGALYAIAAHEKSDLDQAEGAGYRSAAVEVSTESGPASAFTYVARPGAIVAGLYPYSWYKHLVLSGAHHHQLPAAHLARLEAVDSCADPDGGRNREQMEIVLAMEGPTHIYVADQFSTSDLGLV